MHKALRTKLVSRLAAVTFACAMLALGFTLSAPSVQQHQIETALLAGYDVSDICAGDMGDLHLAGHCPHCCLTEAALIPAPVVLVDDVEMHLLGAIIIPQDIEAARTVRDPGRGTRAPPVAARPA